MGADTEVLDSANRPRHGETLAASVSSAARRTHIRMGVLVLLSLGTTINYLDRAVLGIAAPLLSRELHLGAGVLGLLFSAFSWTYAAAQVPGGVLLDRFGTRLVYGLAVSVWSVFTLLQGMVSGLGALLACRLGLGAAEAPCYPATSRVLGTWFPQVERARANGVFSLGQYFGLAFLSPVLFWIAASWGWRALFWLAGSLGALFAAGWFMRYREPHESSHVNEAELEHIRAGGGLIRDAGSSSYSWRNMRRLLANRQFLGAALGQYASNSTLVFFLTWFPTYLANAHHIAMRSAGLLAALPYLAASAGVLLGGWWSDWLIRRTGSATIGRKAPIVTGLCMASTLVLSAFVHSNAAVIGIMSFVFFGQGMCNLGWTLITDLSPPGLRGLTTGTFNLFTNIAGITTPLVIGLVVGSTSSFLGGLGFVSAVAVLGVLCYLVLLGPVRRIELEDGRAPG